MALLILSSLVCRIGDQDDVAEEAPASKNISEINTAERRRPMYELIDYPPSMDYLSVGHVLIVSISRPFPNPLRGFGEIKAS